MRIAVPREQQQGEARVALTPESVKKLVAAGAEVGIETARAFTLDLLTRTTRQPARA
jgi:alanine dehydrogenase